MKDKEKLPTEKQIAIYDMLDAKCTVTDEGVQGFLTWKQIRDVYNSIVEEPVSEDLEKASIEFSKEFGDWQYAIPCFKAGVQWDRKQGETIEAYIRRNRYTKNNVLNIDVVCEAVQKLKPGRVIVQIKNKEE